MIQNTNYGASKNYVNAALSNTYTKAEIDNTVVKLTGNQTKTGILTLLSSPVIKNPNISSSSTVPSGHVQTRIVFTANDDTRLLTLEDWCYSGGSSTISLSNGVTRNGLTPNPALNITVSDTGVGILQAMNQRAYNASNTTDVATIGTLDAYTPMVRTTGNQKITGYKDFQWIIRQQNLGTPGNTSPASYVTGTAINMIGSDEGSIVGLGFEKSTGNTSRFVVSIFGNLNTTTNKKTFAQIHFIFDEGSKQLRLQPAYSDENGVRTFGTSQTLMSWS